MENFERKVRREAKAYIDGLSGEKRHHALAYWRWMQSASEHSSPDFNCNGREAEEVRVALHRINMTGERVWG
jgi:hypothetical protein